MANYWKFTNKNGGSSPEIELSVTETGGERILLFNLLNGYYGTPVITGGDQNDGMASKMILSFETGAEVPGYRIFITNETNDCMLNSYWNETEEQEFNAMVAKMVVPAEPLFDAPAKKKQIFLQSPGDGYTLDVQFFSRSAKEFRTLQSIELSPGVQEIEINPERLFWIWDNGEIQVKGKRYKSRTTIMSPLFFSLKKGSMEVKKNKVNVLFYDNSGGGGKAVVVVHAKVDGGIEKVGRAGALITYSIK